MIQFSEQDKKFIMENFENAKDILADQDIKKVLRVCLYR